jgi:hypothetical protein
MVTLEYPNGYFCTYKAIHCAEGYRYGCEKCLRASLAAKTEEAKDWTRDMWESRNTVSSGFSAKVSGLFNGRQPNLSTK